MRIVFDIEANGLYDPTRIWLIVCKDIDTGEYHIFREGDYEKFIDYSKRVTLWVGHNILGYDFGVMDKLLPGGFRLPPIPSVIDTLIISRLVDYPRDKHGIESYGDEFGIEKGKFYDFSKFTPAMEEYCIRDVDICHRVYLKYLSYISKADHRRSIASEHEFALVCNKLTSAGFALDVKKTRELLAKVEGQLGILDVDIQEAFQPRLKLIREVTPKETKYGTISLSSIPKNMREDIADLSVGSPFSYCSWVDFNPSSHKQIVTVLNEAGWRPVDKTDTHKDTERELSKLKRSRNKTSSVDIEIKLCEDKLLNLSIYGWKVNEENLTTLPDDAPLGATLLSKRILYESRRRTLTEMNTLVQDDGRVHGTFQGIGAWTHRMSHQKPNMANVANAIKVSDGSVSLLGKELRQCWIAPKGRLLVGVDAEAIQLRVFAHLINDPALTDAIVNGSKKLGTDPHSLNKIYFGEFCKTRNAAKHSLYAMFFGGGASKIAEIMDCRKEEAQQSIDRLVQKYPGLQELQQDVFPRDARRGWFLGLDGRRVRIPGDEVGYRKHLAMSGYLQNGEKVIMAEATLRFEPLLKDYDSYLVNLVHDEWQTECPNDFNTCIRVAELECLSLVEAGIDLGLNCPIAGSYRNDAGDYTFGKNWYETH